MAGGDLTLYFLAESLVQRTMVQTMKTVATAASEATAMRHCWAMPRVEQGKGSPLGWLLGTTQGADEVDVVDGMKVEEAVVVAFVDERVEEPGVEVG